MVIEQNMDLPAAWFVAFSDSGHTNGAFTFLSSTSGPKSLKKSKVEFSGQSSEEPQQW